MLTLAMTAAVLAPQAQDFIQQKIDRDAAASRVRPDRGADYGNWNAGYQVLFKGKIVGSMTAPNAYGETMQSIMVKTSNGGLAHVELGPQDYVESQGIEFSRGSSLWVAGSKTFDGSNWVVLAQRVNLGGFRPAFRKQDGTPFWSD